MIYVRNAHGDYSMPIKPYETTVCAAYGCTETKTDRAHVRKCDSLGRITNFSVYVIPLCSIHNRSRTDEPIHVKDTTDFIPIRL